MAAPWQDGHPFRTIASKIIEQPGKHLAALSFEKNNILGIFHIFMLRFCNKNPDHAHFFAVPAFLPIVLRMRTITKKHTSTTKCYPHFHPCRAKLANFYISPANPAWLLFNQLGKFLIFCLCFVSFSCTRKATISATRSNGSGWSIGNCTAPAEDL